MRIIRPASYNWLQKFQHSQVGDIQLAHKMDKKDQYFDSEFENLTSVAVEISYFVFYCSFLVVYVFVSIFVESVATKSKKSEFGSIVAWWQFPQENAWFTKLNDSWEIFCKS